MDSLTLKHSSFQTQNKEKATHSFVPRPLILSCKKKLYFNNTNDICMSWSSKNWPEDNFLNLERSETLRMSE